MYRTQSIDTAIEAERFQLDLLRQAGPIRRFRQVRSLTAATRQMSWATLRKRQAGLTVRQLALAFVGLIYGKELATELSGQAEGVEGDLMLSHDLVEAIAPVVAVLDRLGVPYLIGGSVASSILGIPRSTNDADLVADLQAKHVAPFVAALQTEYYVSETAMREALSRKASFNLIHQATMLKIDVFIFKCEPFEQVEMARRVRSALVEGLMVNLASAEDMILRKLSWYQAGGGLSEKQWLDVLGILKMQTANLDVGYMQGWAIRLNIAGLLEQALREAGLTE